MQRLLLEDPSLAKLSFHGAQWDDELKESAFMLLGKTVGPLTPLQVTNEHEPSVGCLRGGLVV